MPNRLLILSDLWGFDGAAYLDLYLTELEPHFDSIQVYDSCILSELPQHQDSQEERHQHFVAGGIERAVGRLIEAEKEAKTVLAFSIGGTIAWRAALAGIPLDLLFAISATRLRYEVERPDCKIKLWYGSLDPYQPSAEWYEKMQLSAFQWPGYGHDMYREANVIQAICNQLLAS